MRPKLVCLRLATPILLFVLVLPLRPAVLEGVVLEGHSGKALARARVSLETVRTQGRPPDGETLSDSIGRFRFEGLPGGVYRLKAQKSGYVPARFGQRRWNGGGTPISLDASSQFFADVKMHKPGVITGEMLDENGVGLAGLTVHAYRAEKRPFRAVAYALTDDRGVYRLAVEPGLYSVANAPTHLEDGRGLLPTFLGQTASARDARAVEVKIDEEVAVRSIEPIAGQLGKLSGTVQGGVPASIALYTDTGKQETQVGPGGRFEFQSLAPGTYPLIAVSQDGPSRAAYVRVQVSDRAQHVVLSLAPMSTVRLRAEENGRPSDSDQISAYLARNPPFETFSVSLRGGETAIAPPGEYTAYATAPSGYYVESVRASARRRPPDATDAVEAIPGDTLDVTVSVRSSPAELKGKVTAPDGQPAAGARVFLKPLPEGRRTYTGGGDRANVDSSGEYIFNGLPPGRYKVFSSFEILEPGAADWNSDDILTITLGENEKRKLDLKLVGGM